MCTSAMNKNPGWEKTPKNPGWSDTSCIFVGINILYKNPGSDCTDTPYIFDCIIYPIAILFFYTKIVCWSVLYQQANYWAVVVKHPV